MGETVQQPRCTKYDFGLQGTLFGSTPSKQIPEASSNVQREISVSGYRNPDTLRERGNQNDRFKSGKIFELHLFSRKERFKLEVSHQSEKLDPAYPLRTFQSGGIISFKRALERRGFSIQGRLERSILRCSIARRITEFCMFRMERQTILIFCLCFGLVIYTLIRKSFSESEGLSKVNEETLLYGKGSSASTSTIQGPSTTTNYKYLHEEVIQGHNCVTQGGKN